MRPTPRDSSHFVKDASQISQLSTASAPFGGPSTVQTGNIQAARLKLEGLDENSTDFRLLNALLTHAPTVKAVDVIATDIIAASEEPDGLQQLAEFYTTAYGRTQEVSFHPSRDAELKSDAENIATDLEAAKRDPAMLKKYTLRRDGHRCVVTRKWDIPSLSIPEVKSKFDATGGFSCKTQAAHILPFSLMSCDTKKKLFKKSTIWAVIQSLSNIEFQELNGDNINSLANVITLDTALQSVFGPLYVWFEAVPGKRHTYKIRKSLQHAYGDIVADGAEITLTSPNPETLPLPDTRYLAFHAAVAKVVHVAGVAEYLDDIIRQNGSIRVLSDESGAEYLDGRLRIAQRVAPLD